MNYFINFSCTGGFPIDAEDKDQAEFDALNYVRDTFPEVSGVEITDIKEI